MQLDFDDVLAEPSAAQGFEWVWKLAFVVFSQTKSWFYKLFSAVVAVPAALMWAIVFALVTVVYIWIVSPALRLFDLSLAIVKRVSYYCTLYFYYCHVSRSPFDLCVLGLKFRYIYILAGTLFRFDPEASCLNI